MIFLIFIIIYYNYILCKQQKFHNSSITVCYQYGLYIVTTPMSLGGIPTT